MSVSLSGNLSRMTVRRLAREYLRRRGYEIRKTYQPLMENPEAGLRPSIDMLLHFVEAVAGPVTFAEIGAFDGEQGDPLREHIRRGKWRGVVVEPQSGVFERLAQNYAGEDQVVLVQAAVGRTAGRATLYQAADDSLGELNWTHQQASLSKDQVLRLRDKLPDLKTKLYEEEVDVITFDEVLRRAEMSTCDVVQIDTEGCDWDVLQSIDLAKLRPKLVIYEHKHLSWADREAAVDYLVRNRYRVAEVSPRDTAGLAQEVLTADEW